MAEVNLFYLWHIISTGLPLAFQDPSNSVPSNNPPWRPNKLSSAVVQLFMQGVQLVKHGRRRNASEQKLWCPLHLVHQSWSEAGSPGKAWGTSPYIPCQTHCLLPSRVGNRNSSQLVKLYVWIMYGNVWIIPTNPVGSEICSQGISNLGDLLVW